jgi:hypothetical protein
MFQVYDCFADKYIFVPETQLSFKQSQNIILKILQIVFIQDCNFDSQIFQLGPSAE